MWDHVSANAILYKDVPAEALGLSNTARAGRTFASAMVSETMPKPNEMDPVCRWSLDAAKRAWDDAGTPEIGPGRAGVYVANLTYPSRAHAGYASDIWKHGTSQRSAESVLNASLPPHLISTELGLSGPAYALDAACASSLYAIEIGCRRLQARQIDCALIVGVNAADNLILHIGFDALHALSPTGRSRPFVAGADGLVPSEGAVAVVLKRLTDVTPKDSVHGIIRGVGLSNDGRRKGYLAPSADGQVEAMQKAYAMANIDPTSIDFLECHATGTAVGDATELQASARVFKKAKDLKLGSLKSNLGHLITAAGLASLLKVTQAMAAEILPSTPVDGSLVDELDGTPFTVPTNATDWPRGKTPRRAAISNFGFGGNNAHLIVEQFEKRTSREPELEVITKNSNVGICGIGLLGGSDRGCNAVLRRLMNSPLNQAKQAATIGADPRQVRIPPNDLMQAEPQQLAILDVVEEALTNFGELPAKKTGIFVAMECAADSARWLLRERLLGQPETRNYDEDDLDKVAPKLEAPTVLGAMANMMANRTNSSRDLRGQGFAISAGAASGIAALDAAFGALNTGTIDVAIVAAADFATEPVRAHALSMLQPGARPGDLAAALVLQRSTDISDDKIIATLGDTVWQTNETSSSNALEQAYGYAPAASTLFEIGLTSFASERGVRLHETGAHPILAKRPQTTDIGVRSTPSNGAAQVKIKPSAPRPCPDVLRPPPFLFWAAASSLKDLGKRLRKGTPGGKGSLRIAIVSPTESDHSNRLETASKSLLAGHRPGGEGIYVGEGPAEGELAFMFTGSAAVYPRMGRGLLSAFPKVSRRFSKVDKALEISELLAKASLTEFEQLCTGTLIGQAHAVLLLDELGLQPDAAIGLSLGESSALFAFGIWNDPGALLDEISDAAMYERHIGGDFETAQSAWGANVPADWCNWRVQAPIEHVRACLAKFPGVEITIIYTESECMIGGPADQCRAFCAALGNQAVTAKMNQHLIVHAEAMRPFEDTWRRLHTRRVKKREDIRVYANAINAAYKPTSKRIAEMLTQQATSTVDFPKTIEQAWADGVRTFVELGPRDTLTQSVKSILEDKPHQAVATDRIDRSDLGQICELVATLFAEGRAVDMKYVDRHLRSARQRVRPPRPAFPVTRT
ncbi:MAG: beta-ketoacyl synthase N-terminal-like domain-containing protein, partial [Pseudomonadota bacterium]